MSILSRRAFIAAGLALCLPVMVVVGARAQVQHATPASGTRVALKGYDPVSYFTDGKPEQGSAQFTFGFDDTTYWFKTAEHRDKFASDPERYAPQFDGYCAMMLSRGHKVEADPEAWTVTNGKLYVFAGKPGAEKFVKESVAFAEKAKGNWPQVSKQPAVSLSEAMHR
jgi:YHS domain-containing protein